jgi:hypothetical protein
MNYCKELKKLFSHDELSYITKEATLVYTDENDEVDYLLWLRDNKLHAEIRVEQGDIPKIFRLDESDHQQYEKDEFLEILKNSKPSKLTYLEVD